MSKDLNMRDILGIFAECETQSHSANQVLSESSNLYCPIEPIATESQFMKIYRNVESEQLAEQNKRDSALKEYASIIAERVSSKTTKSKQPKKIRESADKVDTVTVDVPLLIRLLEYSREDAKTDMDLHNVTEKLIALSKQHSVLSMDQYDAIVGDQKALPSPDQEM